MWSSDPFPYFFPCLLFLVLRLGLNMPGEEKKIANSGLLGVPVAGLLGRGN